MEKKETRLSKLGHGAGIVIALAVLIALALLQHLFSENSAQDPFASTNPVDIYRIDTTQTFVPLMLNYDFDQNKVALGKKLFHEKKLSSGEYSCASCHDLSKAGTDGRKLARSIDGTDAAFNSPTVFNVGLNYRQGWRGYFHTLDEQLARALYNPKRMNTTWPDIISRLKQIPDYVKSFKSIYRDGISEKNITDALVTFQMSLITPNSAFDRYLLGENKALTEDQKAGFRLFQEYGCQVCHQGINLGGNLSTHPGLFDEALSGRLSSQETQRYKNVLKVPGLRNVVKTGPYFHDGSVNTIEQAIVIMAKEQLGRNLSSADTYLISEFLHTLTGEYQGKPL